MITTQVILIRPASFHNAHTHSYVCMYACTHVCMYVHVAMRIVGYIFKFYKTPGCGLPLSNCFHITTKLTSLFIYTDVLIKIETLKKSKAEFLSIPLSVVICTHTK